MYRVLRSCCNRHIHKIKKDKNKKEEVVRSYTQINRMEKKIMLVLMIKNESKIIERCISHAEPVANAIFVSDTGSTDDTLEVLNRYFSSSLKPHKMVQEEWRNFGHNRTLSFQAARRFAEELEWPLSSTYALVLDADMKLVIHPEFNIDLLTEKGYDVLQMNGHLEYYNKRLLRFDMDWKSVGV